LRGRLRKAYACGGGDASPSKRAKRALRGRLRRIMPVEGATLAPVNEPSESASDYIAHPSFIRASGPHLLVLSASASALSIRGKTSIWQSRQWKRWRVQRPKMRGELTSPGLADYSRLYPTALNARRLVQRGNRIPEGVFAEIGCGKPLQMPTDFS